jgi:hypothetical protein
MLVSVSECLRPSTVSLSASVCLFIASASSYLSWLSSTPAKLLILVSVSGCSRPSTVWYSASVCLFIASASLHLPWRSSICAKLFTLVSVSRCSRPSTVSFNASVVFSSPNTTSLTPIDTVDMCSASPAFPCRYAYHAALYSNRAHFLSESLSYGRCANTALACGNSA